MTDHAERRLFKNRVYHALLQALHEELKVVETIAWEAHEGTKLEHATPEDEFDTFGLEESYLAAGHTLRADEIRRSIHDLQGLIVRTWGKDEPIGPGALVETEQNEVTNWWFISPVGGGQKLSVDDQEVVVLTPESPVGGALFGRTAGDSIAVETGGGTREYDIVEVD